MGYRLARAVQRDLDRVYTDGIRKFGIDSADRYLLGMFDTFDLLSDEPGIGVRRTSRGRAVRTHTHGSHIIVYRTVRNGIEILRVRHQREDWASAYS